MKKTKRHSVKINAFQRQVTMYFVSQMYIKCDSLSVEKREMMPCLLLAEQIKKKRS